METQSPAADPGAFAVIGATGGIGSALTRRLVGHGHRVLAADTSLTGMRARCPPETRGLAADYNQNNPNSSVGDPTPAEFANQFRTEAITVSEVS